MVLTATLFFTAVYSPFLYSTIRRLGPVCMDNGMIHPDRTARFTVNSVRANFSPTTFETFVLTLYTHLLYITSRYQLVLIVFLFLSSVYYSYSLCLTMIALIAPHSCFLHFVTCISHCVSLKISSKCTATVRELFESLLQRTKSSSNVDAERYQI